MKLVLSERRSIAQSLVRPDKTSASRSAQLSPAGGWFFPSAKDPSKPVSAATLYSFMWRQRDRGVIPVVTNRDLRRTWKTLAGKAGVSKEIRDRLQNHTLQDVSSKSYDRWNYMPEKRAGMAKWDKFVTALLSKKPVRTAA
jgi:integrase